MNKYCLAFVLICFGLISAGCVERTIHITSQPTGALVRLNDQEVGRTPMTVPFKFYGDYSVRLSKDGYKTKWTHKRTNAPFWDYPGLDLIAETIPGAKVNYKWKFELKKATASSKVNASGLLERAKNLRQKTEQTQPSN